MSETNMADEMPPSPLVDAEARELIRSALDETLAVEAAAGTGKTTVLVDRIVNVLARGLTTVDRLVAVTFTEKAAGELKLRLRARLDVERECAPSDAVRAHLDAALANLEQAHVSTIHGFCADLLRERPVEARVDPRFTTLTEAQAERLYGELFRDWLQRQLEAPPEGVRRALRRPAFDAENGPIDRLQRAGWTLVEWRDFEGEWRRDPFARDAAIDRLVTELEAFAALTESPGDRSDPFYNGTREARRLHLEITLGERVRPRDYDGLEARLAQLATNWKFRHPSYGRKTAPYRKGVPRTEVIAAHERLVASLEAFQRAADADLAALLQRELRETVDRYREAKTRIGALDFLDLLICARDLVRGHEGVRTAFQERFTHLFVDEFQDTDPLQAELLLLLAADDARDADWRTVAPRRGKLFVVGDPKQSIYRFRRADVGIYQQVRDQLARHGARLLTLTTNFRSAPTIQRFVNAGFAPIMRGDAAVLQADYVPLSPARDDVAGQPGVVALSIPRPFGVYGRVRKEAINESLPDAVGAFVHWLVTQSGWTVTERDAADRPVPIQARHVCLLFRRFDTRDYSRGGAMMDMTRPYVQALEARGIPHVLVGGKSFHDREEVETLRTALAAVEWPDDELSVFGTLRGAFFAIDDETLFVYRQRVGRLNPFRQASDVASPGGTTADAAAGTTVVATAGAGADAVSASVSEPDPWIERFRPIDEALDILRELHARRNYRPVAETIARLLDASRAHVAFALRPSGEQALANVLYIAELARQYEACGGISFRGFVEQLRDEAETTRSAEAPILEEGSDGVRIMTVHRAKGLEFPIVILADTTAELSRRTASRWVDSAGGRCAVSLAGWAPADLRDHEAEEVARDEAEGVRVAYVAATRARDLLVVPAVGDEPQSGWVQPVAMALYPELDVRRASVAAPGCPRFGKDSVLDREGPLPFINVSPGLHRLGGASDAAPAPRDTGAQGAARGAGTADSGDTADTGVGATSIGGGAGDSDGEAGGASAMWRAAAAHASASKLANASERGAADAAAGQDAESGSSIESGSAAGDARVAGDARDAGVAAGAIAGDGESAPRAASTARVLRFPPPARHAAVARDDRDGRDIADKASAPLPAAAREQGAETAPRDLFAALSGMDHPDDASNDASGDATGEARAAVTNGATRETTVIATTDDRPGDAVAGADGAVTVGAPVRADVEDAVDGDATDTADEATATTAVTTVVAATDTTTGDDSEADTAASAGTPSDASAYDVVWWDPAALELGRAPAYGLRREELIAKDAPPQVLREGLERYYSWRAHREGAVERGSVPTLRVLTVRARAAALGNPPPAETVPDDALSDDDSPAEDAASEQRRADEAAWRGLPVSSAASSPASASVSSSSFTTPTCAPTSVSTSSAPAALSASSGEAASPSVASGGASGTSAEIAARTAAGHTTAGSTNVTDPRNATDATDATDAAVAASEPAHDAASAAPPSDDFTAADHALQRATLDAIRVDVIDTRTPDTAAATSAGSTAPASAAPAAAPAAKFRPKSGSKSAQKPGSKSGSSVESDIATAPASSAGPANGPGPGSGASTSTGSGSGAGSSRPGGARFGALVHAVLGFVALDASPAAVDRLIEQQARVLGATDAERRAAAPVIAAALRHPLFDRARAAAARGRLRRETPLALTDNRGAVIEGVIDLAFEEDAGWVIVDFKTDQELAGVSLDAYRRQVQLYAHGISRATGRPATGILLRL